MNIGLLGMGAIGSGVFEQLAAREDITVRRVLDKRKIEGVESLLTTDIAEILGDPEIDTVVELMGGNEPAHRFVLEAMRAGKNVVSANKLMIAGNLKELLDTAQQMGVSFRFSASVGGSIPYLVNLLRARRADRLTRVMGIVNGTTNLILDTMQTTGESFDQVLKQAQAAAYAEADPSADIDGIDARSKIAIAASLAFDAHVRPENVLTAGIRYIRAEDVELFRKKGWVCRLIARAERFEGDRVTAFVEPTLVTPESPFASVYRNDNLICMNGKRFGQQSFSGQGAGKSPTAYAVVNDLIDTMYSPQYLPFSSELRDLPVDNGLIRRCYYLRTSACVEIPGETLAAKNGFCAYVTQPMPVQRMHTLAKELQKQDPSLFLAGISD